MRSGRSPVCEYVALGQHHGALDGVLELAHVAGPGVLEQELARLGRRGRGCCVPRRALLRATKWSMSRLMSSRRARSGGIVNRQDVDAVEEVLAEAPGLRLGGEIAVRRGDDAHVDLDVLRVAEAPDRLLLQHAQQLHLQVQRAARRSRRGTACRRRPPRRGPRRSAFASVKAPFLWPNSSLSSRFSGIAPQLMATNGAALRVDSRVDGARDELLADAALARDEHRGLEVGDLRDGPEDVEHLRALGEDRLELVLLPDLLLERAVLAPQRLALLGLAQREHDLVGLEGLARRSRRRRPSSPRAPDRRCRRRSSR